MLRSSWYRRFWQWPYFLTMLFSTSVLAQSWPDVLLLSHDGEDRALPIETLREQADETFSFYDPYLGRDVDIRGLPLGEWARASFGDRPERLTLEAVDGFEVVFDEWPGPSWVLVTHHDGEPIGLREKGPLRLVERDYGDRDLDNLRSFNEWIWMIERIEAAP